MLYQILNDVRKAGGYTWTLAEGSKIGLEEGGNKGDFELLPCINEETRD